MEATQAPNAAQAQQSPMDDGSGNWDAATQGAAPAGQQPQPANGSATPSQPAKPQRDTGLDQMQIPAEQQQPRQPVPVQAIAAPPPTAARVPRAGIGGFIDKMLDSMVGTDVSKVRTDPDGNLYIQHETPTRGQQWLKIAGEALRGASAGWAEGKGQGNQGKALLAGVQAQKQAQQDQSEEEKQQMLQVANSQILKHKIAEQAFDLQRRQVEATQHDVEFSEGQADRLKGQGAVLKTHVESLQDLTKFMRDTPNFNQDQVKNDTYTPVATYGPDGKPNGFDVYAKMPGSDDEVQPAGTKIPVFNPVTGEITYQKTSGPKTTGEINAIWLSAGTAAHKYALDEATIKEKNAQAQKVEQGPQETESTTKLHRSEVARNNAAAEESRSKAARTTEAQTPGGLIDRIGTGHIVPERMSFLLARNPDLLDQVTQRYPDFDGAKAQAYPAAVKDFTSGDTSKKINAGATALGHMLELRELNTTMSHVPGTAAWNRYQNKVDTLATELAKFYGDSTIPGIANIKKTLASNLPGTRDAAIETQAQSMGDKFDSYEQQWKNAAPTTHYQAQMPGMSEKAKEARASMDPKYRRRLVEERRNGGQGQNAPVQVTPGEPTATAADGSTLVVRNGQWVAVQH